MPSRQILCLAALLPIPSLVSHAGIYTERVYLSGQGPDDAVAWQFFCTEGRRSGEWATIPVPSNWEFHGFGEFNYGHDSNKSAETGMYRHRFEVPSDWEGKRIRIVFDGVMTDAEVRINGQVAGPVHQGGFYRFRHDITELVRYGQSNRLDVRVDKVSTDTSLEIAERSADYWVYGGIYRPVFLEILPASFIDRVAIDARADGDLTANVFGVHLDDSDTLTLDLFDARGTAVGAAVEIPLTSGAGPVRIEATLVDPAPWSAEDPNLYTARFVLRRGGEPIHEVTEQIGFRTIEVRPAEGIFVNGARVRFRGVNRHCHVPESGRALSRADTLKDLLLIKGMNMNAVRSSHYPPDKHMLELCDTLGLYVIDELCTWQKPPIRTGLARKLVRELVLRDVNHPSVVFWANGNEGGFNYDVDADYAKYDPQNRPVIHPWETFNGIDTDHYETYNSLKKRGLGEALYMPTEFLHGLYDGGHGAALEDYWGHIRSSANYAGGFLWVFADEGTVRGDEGGRIDLDGNHAPDGIVGPHREQEGSYQTIREIFSPVQVRPSRLPTDFDGIFSVENDYARTNLEQVEYRFNEDGWRSMPSVGPGEAGSLPAPANWRARDLLSLRVRDRTGHELFQWQWPTRPARHYREQVIPEVGLFPVHVRRQGDQLLIRDSAMSYRFGATDLRLLEVRHAAGSCAIANGPRLVVEGQVSSPGPGGSAPASIEESGSGTILEVRDVAGFDLVRWTLGGGGVLQLDYVYSLTGRHEYFGIGFDLPEEAIEGFQFLGQGPHNVWRNRRLGTRFDQFERAWRPVVWGTTWAYPLAQGYFGPIAWVRMNARPMAFTLATDTPSLYLQLGWHEYDDMSKGNCFPPFPDTNLSVLHAIPAIGTKFHKASDLGPQGTATTAAGEYAGTLFFHFQPGADGQGKAGVTTR